MSADRLTQRELAERWQVSEACLERWRTEGRGPVYMKLIGRVVYRLEDIEAFERASLRASTSQPAPAAAGGAA
jgi:predicted site-specific integrase-resolvase